jgi:hypothetical protein
VHKANAQELIFESLGLGFSRETYYLPPPRFGKVFLSARLRSTRDHRNSVEKVMDAVMAQLDALAVSAR